MVLEKPAETLHKAPTGIQRLLAAVKSWTQGRLKDDTAIIVIQRAD